VIFVNRTLIDLVTDFNRYSAHKIVIADPALGCRTFVGQYPLHAAQLFAQDVGAYLGQPVTVTADRIVIGAGGQIEV